MISLSNTAAQTLTPGQSLIFDNVIVKSGCAECHRANTSSIKFCARNAKAIYEVHFSGNVTNGTAAAPVQLSLALSGDVLPGTTMISTPSAANAVNNVSTSAVVRNNCCDYDRITVTNTGTSDITVSPGAMIIAKRVA